VRVYQFLESAREIPDAFNKKTTKMHSRASKEFGVQTIASYLQYLSTQQFYFTNCSAAESQTEQSRWSKGGDSP
jgi:hypothetical protein